LAPILLEEDFEKYFSINKSIVKNLEWMETFYDAKQELYNRYSSIMHIDGTCRTQIIKDENSLTYKILKNLKENGSDILVNTLFFLIFIILILLFSIFVFFQIFLPFTYIAI
jgi:predicted NodU family carbamoyl transferase